MDGAVIIDKPAGQTSHAIVQAVKKRLGAKKAGHTGTLDPMATGVLPICLNEATKLAGFLAAHDKEYRATMLLGVRTDTLDTEGNVLFRTTQIPNASKIAHVLFQMIGKIKQIPPAYSAIKHQGKPLYQWARKGVFPEPSPREVEIFKIEPEKISPPWVTFRVACSKGTYIRALCADIGEKLGCGACLSSLRRLRCGTFSENTAIPLDSGKDELFRSILPMSQLLPGLKTIPADKALVEKLRNGYQPSLDMLPPHVRPFLARGDMIQVADKEKKLVALVEITVDPRAFAMLKGTDTVARIVRVFNETGDC